MKTVDVNTPMKTNDSDDQKHNLFYTDPCMFTGPMTQLMKAVGMEFQHQDQSNNVMQVDLHNKFDCSSLPNLNDKFSDIGFDGFGQTPQAVRI